MYQKYRKRSQSSQGRNNRFQPRFRHQPKKLDPRFFVQKAVQREEEVFTPKHSFSDFPIDKRLLASVYSRGYKHPTPIQDEAILPLIQGKDVIGIAGTGTGKTAAFLIPLINKVISQRGERVLIIAPTRELAAQISDELKAFSMNLGIGFTLCIGGVNISPQIRQLQRFPQFVIGTPGRLKDLEQQRKLNFYDFRSIVLDEVDCMVDMGFIKDINHIVSKLPKNRQSLFFSATLPEAASKIMNSFVNNPITIKVSTPRPSTNVDQDVIKVNPHEKVEKLHQLLIKPEFQKVLVFGRTKWGMEKLHKDLTQRGFKTAAIHGNKKQAQRQRAIIDFKQNRVQILLATDIASRGLDIQNVTHVINFDQPESYEDYIHRIGRTGRANKRGTALTFID